MNNPITHQYDTFIDDINNSHTINDLVNLKNNINHTIFLYLNNIEELKKLILILEEKINITCKHNWKRDYTYCGEHSQFICEICGLYR
jgi:hypothetical protein